MTPNRSQQNWEHPNTKKQLKEEGVQQKKITLTNKQTIKQTNKQTNKTIISGSNSWVASAQSPS